VLRKNPGRRNARNTGTASRGRDARTTRAARETARPDRFVLYVEGARDREILSTWARRVQPEVVRCIERNTVILGGRQPARALRDFERKGGPAHGWRGLIVLDRDHHAQLDAAEQASRRALDATQGLELFVWSLRHIESYLLVPAAIRRVLGVGEDDPRVDRALSAARTAASHDGSAAREDPHAKRILGSGGALSEALGETLAPGAIARAMRQEELHTDVHALFARIGQLTGIAARTPEVVVRRRKG
jgi:hypothetical protein